VPLFQAFTAYTTGLDELDAHYLGSKKAPRYVLHHYLSIDNRNPRFESPGYVVELVCRYRQVAVAGGWQLLERGPDRCGGPVAIDKRRVKLGQVVRVPKAGRNDIVVARFQDLHESLWQSLRGLVFKRRPLYVTVGGGRVNRFLPGHADSPHLLQPPACSGYDPALFDSSSYPMIGVAHAGRIGKPEASGDYELRIYRVPFRCPDSLPAR
jgi:hypothetical protein